MAQIKVAYTVTLEADAEHTEDAKVTEVSQQIRDQASALKAIYDEGISLTGTIKVTDTDEENL